MAMVDRYKKSGGFVQLLQVLETCGAKKREQFMGIISMESPKWAEAINQKMISLEKIVSWKPEILLEILASVNKLAFAVALKGLPADQLEKFFSNLPHQEKRKLELTMQETASGPNEISSSIVKVITETRQLFISGSLKYDKVDATLSIPENFEEKLVKGDSGTSSVAESAQAEVQSIQSSLNQAQNGGSVSQAEIEKIQKKVFNLNKELTLLKQENAVLKEKLEKIKKIA